MEERVGSGISSVGPTAILAGPPGRSGARMVLKSCPELDQKGSLLYSHGNVCHPKEGYDFE